MAAELLANPRRRVVGTKATLKQLGGSAVLEVYLARDASASVIDPVLKLAEAKSVPVSWVDTMKELGQRCGIQVGAACAGILQT